MVSFALKESMARKSQNNIWRRLKRGGHRFAADKPGRRFLHAHVRWQDARRPMLTHAVFVAAGIILLALGFFLGLIPGVPGIVLGVIGVALIGTRFRRTAIWLDWLEVRCRRIWRRLKRDWHWVSKGLRDAPTLPP